MYDYIKGKLTKITAKNIVVEAGGLGYIVNVANPYSFSNLVNQEVQIYVHQVVREDAQLLFGFHTEDEKSVFLNLISVSGIGPTTALAIIAVDDNEGLVHAIDTSDIKYLMKFPKIGKKQRNRWFWIWQGSSSMFLWKMAELLRQKQQATSRLKKPWKLFWHWAIKPQNSRKSASSLKVPMKQQNNTSNQVLRC